MSIPSRALVVLATCLSMSVVWSTSNADEHTIKADMWADNWFALYSGDQLLGEDSVPYNTERSFNSDSFTFDIELPAQLSVIIKDFKEDDSGLEYIGRRGQQMGDGGFAGQFTDVASGKLLAASSDEWRCLSIHRAPLNKSCQRSANPSVDCQSEISSEPDNWKSSDFDDSNWPHAVVHSAQAVRPRRGYDEIDWASEVKLIWGDDLEIDNTILCRITIAAPD